MKIEILVSAEKGSHPVVCYKIDGEWKATWEVSRAMTRTSSESDRGIFAKDVRVWRGKEVVEISFDEAICPATMGADAAKHHLVYRAALVNAMFAQKLPERNECAAFEFNPNKPYEHKL